MADEVSWFGIHGDDVYLLTSKNMLRNKVVRTSAANPNFEKARTVVPPSEAIITRIEVADDALYVQLQDGGISKMLRVDFKTDLPIPLKLPFEGAIGGLNVDPREPGILSICVHGQKSPAYYFIARHERKLPTRSCNRLRRLIFPASKRSESRLKVMTER